MNPNMTPIDWAKRPLQKYADFSGRAPRAEYWWFVLAVVVGYIVTRILDSMLGLNHMVLGVYGPLTILLWAATIVPSLAVGVRRLHDTNRTGWWLLLPIVPYCLAMALGGAAMMSNPGAGLPAGFGLVMIFMLIGFLSAIALLVFYCLPSTPGDNRYGPNPHEQGASAGATE